MNQFSRLELLLGKDGVKTLNNSKVIVFGVGGVGSYVVEALARSGVGQIGVVDKDVVDITNINRQIIATHSTIGQSKVDVIKSRILDIYPLCKVRCYHLFYNEETVDKINLSEYDYIVDAIDTVTSKLLLIKKAYNNGVKIISSMGTGNKLNPIMLEVSTIDKTSVCPLARVMRKELKNIGINNLKVVYSKEQPITPHYDERYSGLTKLPPASCSFVPSVAGLIIASEVIKDLLDINK